MSILLDCAFHRLEYVGRDLRNAMSVGEISAARDKVKILVLAVFYGLSLFSVSYNS